ncbi:GntR family transcriptional regulator [Nocardiopsis coralliicola]
MNGSGRPLYAQLVETFRERIRSGEWVSGQQLPSERELCHLFGVSRITVRRAIDIAASEGLLDRAQGVGTFVADPRVAQPIDHINSFERTLEERGIVASTRVHAAHPVVGDLQTAAILRIPTGDPAVQLQLVGCGDATPIVFYDSVFPRGLGEEMVAAARRTEGAGTPFSTLDLYREPVSRRPDRLEQTFEATTADPALAGLLEVAEGWPILRVTSLLTAAGEALEYRRAAYRGDRYTFAVDRRLPPLAPGS